MRPAGRVLCTPDIYITNGGTQKMKMVDKACMAKCNKPEMPEVYANYLPDRYTANRKPKGTHLSVVT